MKDKLSLIYKPFLIIAVCIIAGYSFLNWLVFIKIKAFSLNEEIIKLWIPMALPWIPLVIWLRPRIKLLNLKTTRKSDFPSLYVMMAGFAIALPTIIAQFYIETASGTLTNLENISKIELMPETKYYSLQNFYIDKANPGVQSSLSTSGRYNEDLNMDLYIVLPIVTSQNNTDPSNCKGWYGIKYHKQISNRLSDEEKDTAYNRFIAESQAQFDTTDVNRFVYLDRIGNTDDHTEYNTAIKNNKLYASKSTIVLIPVNEPFEARNGSKLPWIFGSFIIGALVWLIMLSIPKLKDEAITKFSSDDAVKPDTSEIKKAFSFFIPKEGFYITPILIDINVFIFILMIVSGLGFISFRPIDLLEWGANYKPYTTHGEWWRLITCMFVHGGFMHLFANMYGLLFVGVFLEPVLGKIRYAGIYLITGIAASIASLYMHDSTVSIGASGAIFGLYGTFFALLLTKVFPKEFNKAFLVSTIFFIGFNLFMGFADTGIDNAAHIGGLISGFIIGLIISKKLKQEAEEKGFFLNTNEDNNPET